MPQRLHQPTGLQRRAVETMARHGIPEKDIARVVGVARTTLRKRYPEELGRGRIQATVAIAAHLFEIASTGAGPEAVSAAIFWLKTRAGWSELSPRLSRRQLADNSVN